MSNIIDKEDLYYIKQGILQQFDENMTEEAQEQFDIIDPKIAI